VSALIGFNGPMVGTFRAGEVLNGCAPASLMMRLTFRVAVSESRETAAGNWTGADYTVLWNGIEIDHIVDRARRRLTTGVLFIGRHEPRKGLRCCSMGGHRPARGSSRRGRSADRRVGTPVAGDVEWFGTVTARCATRCCGGYGVLRTVVEGVVRVVLPRQWPPARRSSSRSTATERGADRMHCWCRPATSRRYETLRRLLDGRWARLVASGHERAEQFSMRRLAERYLELYACAGRVTRPDGQTIPPSASR
jgi:hypothetical protein